MLSKFQKSGISFRKLEIQTFENKKSRFSKLWNPDFTKSGFRKIRFRSLKNRNKVPKIRNPNFRKPEIWIFEKQKFRVSKTRKPDFENPKSRFSNIWTSQRSGLCDFCSSLGFGLGVFTQVWDLRFLLKSGILSFRTSLGFTIFPKVWDFPFCQMCWIFRFGAFREVWDLRTSRQSAICDFLKGLGFAIFSKVCDLRCSQMSGVVVSRFIQKVWGSWFSLQLGIRDLTKSLRFVFSQKKIIFCIFEKAEAWWFSTKSPDCEFPQDLWQSNILKIREPSFQIPESKMFENQKSRFSKTLNQNFRQSEIQVFENKGSIFSKIRNRCFRISEIQVLKIRTSGVPKSTKNHYFQKTNRIPDFTRSEIHIIQRPKSRFSKNHVQPSDIHFSK